jgi:hypothetical protein
MKSRIFLAAGLLLGSAAAVAADKSLTPDDALPRDEQPSTVLDLDRDASPATSHHRTPDTIDLARLRAMPGSPAVSVTRLRTSDGDAFLKF